MEAIVIFPGKKESAFLARMEEPKLDDDSTLVKVLQAGVCRTDLEIYEGMYGEAPKGKDVLVMGHESIGKVEKIGKNVNSLKKGDYVVRTVRRPCNPPCINCAAGNNDMCLTGNYKEVGIKGLHGIMVEHYTEYPNFLVKIPENLKHAGVLLEPLSFAEKTIRQAYEIQERLKWNPQRALVLGSGPIGILSSLILRNDGLKVYTASRSKGGNLKSRIIEEAGAHYVSTSETNLKELGKFDIIVEATGNSEMVFNSLNYLNTNGVLCLTSITGGDKKIEVSSDKINLDLVLGNKVVVGVVNSNIEDYEQGVAHMEEFETGWPGILNKIITREFRPGLYKEAFKKTPEDIKTVINFG